MRYRKEKSALILKVPTPIVMTAKGLIAQQSTVDYVGTLSGGMSIDFDAKETTNKTSFPLANIKQHQLIYLDFKFSLGSIAFLFIHFKKIYKDKAFITPIPFVMEYYNGLHKRKSIPLKEFNLNWLAPINDYLPQVEVLKNEIIRPNKP